MVTRSRQEAAEYVMRVLRELGFDRNEAPRFARMQDLLVSKTPPKSDGELEIILEAHRDIYVMAFVFDQLRGKTDQGELRARVSRLVWDSPLPQGDQCNTPGRDAQSELYVAAICQGAGLEPVFCERPDIVVGLGGAQYGIEVKRLKALGQLGNRFRKGTDQIAQAGVPGFIFFDVTASLNTSNIRAYLPNVCDAFCRERGEQLIAALKQIRAPFIEWKGGRSVLGVMIQENIIVCTDGDDKWELRTLTAYDHLDPSNGAPMQEAHRFFQRFGKGVPNLQP